MTFYVEVDDPAAHLKKAEELDVPGLDASFIDDEIDERASAHGGKGIGELGGVGAGPAIANAVYHATGVRVRELPIRPEMLLGATP